MKKYFVNQNRTETISEKQVLRPIWQLTESLRELIYIYLYRCIKFLKFTKETTIQKYLNFLTLKGILILNYI